VRLANPELDLEVTRTQAACDEALVRLRHATAGTAADIRPLAQRLDALTNRLEKLLQDQRDLVIRARHDGLWIAPELRDSPGRWLVRGTRLGLLVDTNGFQFTATVAQEDADALFARNVSRAEVRLAGQASEVMRVERWQVLPGGQRLLPSAALGWSGGGEVPVAADDPQGRRAVEPFFEVRSELAAAGSVALLHGRAGRVRFELPSEPLLPRGWRRLRQLLQKRYQW
jgi:putative peptide zinc metalloprotease protein